MCCTFYLAFFLLTVPRLVPLPCLHTSCFCSSPVTCPCAHSIQEQLDREAERTTVRRSPLGSDRYHRRYWWDVAGCKGAVLVEAAEGGALEALLTTQAQVLALADSLNTKVRGRAQQSALKECSAVACRNWRDACKELLVLQQQVVAATQLLGTNNAARVKVGVHCHHLIALAKGGILGVKMLFQKGSVCVYARALGGLSTSAAVGAFLVHR
eukprot:1160000-Pelagomonas_calceolata.AAC.11